MKKPESTQLSPTQRRRLLSAARSHGTLAIDRLDAVLLHATETPARMASLVRSLEGVLVTEPENPDDLLATRLDGDVAKALGDDLRRYSELVRSTPRMTREEEHVLARRLEFSRARMSRLLVDIDMPDELRERLLDRGLNCDTIRSEADGLGSDAGGAFDIDALLDELPCGSCDPYIENVVTLYQELRAYFVERNLSLVVGMSSAYRTYGVPMMDLIQEGNASLIRAVEKFDWRKNVRFNTYAAFWVRQAVERLITANRGIVRVPNYIQQKMRRLRREGKLSRNHQDIDVRDMSALFDTDTRGAARLLQTDRSWFSLDAPLGDGDGSFATMLPAEEGEASITDSEVSALGVRLDEVMGQTLTDAERKILVQRFGLDGQPPRTLDAVGVQLGVSRERVRQMQVKAIDKLRKRDAVEPLEDFL